MTQTDLAAGATGNGLTYEEIDKVEYETPKGSSRAIIADIVYSPVTNDVSEYRLSVYKESRADVWHRLSLYSVDNFEDFKGLKAAFVKKTGRALVIDCIHDSGVDCPAYRLRVSEREPLPRECFE